MSTTPIRMAYPEPPNNNNLHMHITVGACSLRLTPGTGDAWVSGTYEDPSELLPCQMVQDGQSIKILQEPFRSAHWGRFHEPPRFDLALGGQYPFTLVLETGASEGNLDLGGLPLRHVSVKWGAGKGTIDFSKPNPETMTLLEVGAGAVGLEMQHLANANCAEMSLTGGAAAYSLDFGGALRRDMQARVSTGLSSLEIRIPHLTPTRFFAESFLGSLDVGDGFTKKDGAFQNESAVAGKSPLLSISATVALGAIRVRLMSS